LNSLIQKILALFSPARRAHPASPEILLAMSGMPLASAAYLREFAQRLGLEVDDLSPAEQAELKARLDQSMDFREENYGVLYHEVYQLGHGYALADAIRVSAQINEISEDPAARAYLDYRENAVAAEALMSAGTLLEQEGDVDAARRLFDLAEGRRHRSSVLEFHLANVAAAEDAPAPELVAENEFPETADDDDAEPSAAEPGQAA
jgi:hypothetical protein